MEIVATASQFLAFTLIALAHSKHVMLFGHICPESMWNWWHKRMLFHLVVNYASRVYFDSEKQYFEHLGSHLRWFEKVLCVFKNCNFSTNIYSTFATHRRRKHTWHSLDDFKTEVLQKHPETSVDPVVTSMHDDPGPLEDEPIVGWALFEIGEHFQCTKQMHWRDSRWASLHVPLCIWSSFKRSGWDHLEKPITVILVQL